MERPAQLEQGVAEVGQLGAVGRIGGEAGVDREAEGRRQLRPRLGEALDRLADRPRGRGGADPDDRVEPRPELIEGEAEGIDVGGSGGPLPGGLFRGHVGEGADDLAGRRQGGTVLERRDPEVGEQRPLRRAALDAAGAGRADEDVVGLQVAVDDAGVVGVGERRAELGPELGDLAVGDLAAGGELAQVRALDQLTDQIRAAPEALVLPSS